MKALYFKLPNIVLEQTLIVSIQMALPGQQSKYTHILVMSNRKERTSKTACCFYCERLHIPKHETSVKDEIFRQNQFLLANAFCFEYIKNNNNNRNENLHLL